MKKYKLILTKQNRASWMLWKYFLFFSVFVGGVFFETLNLSDSQMEFLYSGFWIGLVFLNFSKNSTLWGDLVLAEIKQHHNCFDPIQRFALYGEIALSGGALDDLKQIYKAQQEADTGGCGCGC